MKDKLLLFLIIFLFIFFFGSFNSFAKDYSKEMIKLKKKLKIVPDIEKGEIYLKLSYSSFENSNKNDFAFFSKRTLEHAKKFKLEELENDVLRIISLKYTDNKMFHKAKKCLVKALKIAEKIGDKKRYTYTLNFFYLLYEEKKDFKKKIEIKNKLLKIYREEENDIEIATVYQTLASLHIGNGSIDKAVFYLNKAYKGYKKIGNVKMTIHLQTYIGTLYLYAGYTKNALEVFKDIDEKLKTNSNKLKSVDFNELKCRYLLCMGEYYRILKDYKRSGMIFDKCITLSKRSGFFLFIRNVYYKIVLASIENGEIDKADSVLEYYYISYKKRFKDLDDLYFPSVYNLLKGMIKIKKSKLKDALFFLKKAFDIAEKEGDNFLKCRLKKEFGLLYLKLNDFKKSELFLLDSLKIGKKHKELLLVKDCYLYLSELYQKTGNKDKGQKYFKLYNDIKNIKIKFYDY